MLRLQLLLKALPYLTKQWKLTSISILTAFIWYQNTQTELKWDIVTIPHVAAELKKSKVELQKSVNSNAVLSKKLEQRNEEVREWQESTHQLELEFEALQREILGIRKNTDYKVKQILKRKTAETCDEAFGDLSKGIEDIKWND